MTSEKSILRRVISADDVRVACPLFHAERSGSIPTSALHLTILPIATIETVKLNRLWHSRLPEIGNAHMCFCYVAEHDGIYYAVAMWSPPVARAFNGRGYLELRRLAIANDAPKNTASRMIAIMTRLIRRERPETKRLISYQDTEVHDGTIYRAAGWTPCVQSSSARIWNMPNRYRKKTQTAAPKIRWEKILHKEATP